MKQFPSTILISRTDAIGDVVLTLPMAAALKNLFPAARIGFIGKPYTAPVIEACAFIDAFVDKEAFLTKPVTIAGYAPDAIVHVFPDASIALRAFSKAIRWRVGTTNRLFHWGTCNKLVKLSRRNALLHEAQLNLKLLSPFGYQADLSTDVIGGMFGLTQLQPLPNRLQALLDPLKYKLILHPASQGSAREWGLPNFIELIRQLDKNIFQIFISGTSKEQPVLTPLFDQVGSVVTDLTGQMNLAELMAFIAAADGLVANSTGPLHLAAALGKDALGIYPPLRPIHPGRWAPIGAKARVFVLKKECNDCRNNPSGCYCIRAINPASVKETLNEIVYTWNK